MKAKLKANLQVTLQEWLDKNCDEIGGDLGIWQDTDGQQNSYLMMQAAFGVLEAMALQSRLETKLNPRDS